MCCVDSVARETRTRVSRVVSRIHAERPRAAAHPAYMRVRCVSVGCRPLAGRPPLCPGWRPWSVDGLWLEPWQLAGSSRRARPSQSLSFGFFVSPHSPRAA